MSIFRLSHAAEPIPATKVERITPEVEAIAGGFGPPDQIIAKRQYQTPNDLEIQLIDWRGAHTASVGPIIWYFEERMRGAQRIILASVSVRQLWNQWHHDGGEGSDAFGYQTTFWARGHVGGNALALKLNCGSTNRVCGHPSEGPKALAPTGGPNGNASPINYVGVSILEDADDTIWGYMTFSDPDGPCFGR